MTRRREPEKGVVELFENVINTFLENEDLSELYHKAPESIVFPFAAQQTSREFKKLCGGHHLHELRHTFITRCCESGVNPSVCQQLVGHATGDMIMNVYMHVMDEFKRKEAAKFTLFPKF